MHGETEKLQVALASLDDVEEFVNVLYFGDPGSGKTTAAAHMAKLGKVIVVDAEAGLKKRPLQRLGIPTSNIYPYSIGCYEDLDTLYWQTKAKLEEEPGYFAGVVFDSMTEIQKKLIESIVQQRHDKAMDQAKRGGFTVQDDPFAVDRDEYGKMTEMVRRVSRRFRDLPCHTAFVCLAKREVDKEGSGEVVYRPALTPAFASDLMGYVDVVGYTQQAEGETDDRSRYVAVTRPIGKFRGKDRYGATPEMMPNPTFDRILEYVLADDPIEHQKSDPFVQQRLERLGFNQAPPAEEPPVEEEPPNVEPLSVES
jgi:hypothetical protein